MNVRITKLRLAFAGLFVLAGVGIASMLSPLVGSALATAGQIVNVSDPTAAYTAHVTSGGALKTNGVVTGSVAPAAPASPWRASEDINLILFPGVAIAGPNTAPIEITSVSVSTLTPSGTDSEVSLYAAHVPSTATSCSGATVDGTLWHVLNAGGPTTPVTVSFPTPLQWKPPANTKACLFAATSATSQTTLNASGFYG